MRYLRVVAASVLVTSTNSSSKNSDPTLVPFARVISEPTTTKRSSSNSSEKPGSERVASKKRTMGAAPAGEATLKPATKRQTASTRPRTGERNPMDNLRPELATAAKIV